ncbi:unnamed protein product [Ostreobium quekettii]|uniref:Uncharacterized protein n=1 Tax=Ostreobium quekettii TaxID=121088 RepID=A0A8S1IL65_9CHLO|nr:unnamed protein product [Ostreobium quekettii]|eukprot:evm.model.scf_461.7 EVM.evm.TU.scf_461.7   scf_461:44198-46219(-)
MGKNQAYKAMQRAKHATTADGHLEAEDGSVDASFHTPLWHAARVAALKVQRIPWEEWKKKMKEDEEGKSKVRDEEERVMREYRAQLDADREARLGTTALATEPKTKKRKRSEKDRERKKSRKKDKKERKVGAYPMQTLPTCSDVCVEP